MATTDLQRIRVSGDTRAMLDEASERTGHSYDTLIQLWGTAAGRNAEAAATALKALNMRAATQEEMRQDLAGCAPNLRITAIRLDQLHSSPSARDADGYGFERECGGADFTTDGAELWRSVRGYWVVGLRSNAIAAFRLGKFRALYAGVSWSAAKNKRRYALTGYRIEGRKRLDPDSGTVIGAASEEEITALEYLENHTLGMPPGAANPIANLFSD
ncbi:hypothetical protein [Nocardia nova]|jgi:hypothetical protein|uniref:hypothetical protein n=1 Tax=Nocardia nova TaxID=37330 RepID=UPI0007A3E68A|nr:hypothetical protein [Nocardia nova]